MCVDEKVSKTRECTNVINLKKNFTNTYHWVSDRGQLIKNEDDILD